MAEMYDHELERKVLAIVANNSTTDVNEALLLLQRTGLQAGDFHKPANNILFGKFDQLLRSGKPVDPLTVKSVLQSPEALEAAGGNEHIVDVIMGDHEFGASSLAAYAEAMRSMSLRRQLAKEVGTAWERIKSGNDLPEEIAADLAGKVSALRGGSKLGTLRETLGEVSTELDAVQSGESDPVTPTGIACLDAVIGGVQPTLTLVGALPGVGKSALFATVCRNLASSGTKVGIISCEDAISWLAYRILSHEAKVNQFKLRFKKMNQYDLEKTGEAYARLYGYAGNVIVYDGSEDGMSWDQVVSVAQDMVINHGCKMVLLDHVGEVLVRAGDGAGRSAEIARGLSRLRGVANKHGIGVWAAMHLKRRDGLGPGDEPSLTDFADTAGAERKARVAIGLCRHPDSDELSMCILKQTMGKAGLVVKAKFEGSAAMVRSIEGPQ